MADRIAEQRSDGNIIIGAGVEFKGNVTVPGCASIDGKFEGVLTAKNLIVGQTGRVSGEIGAETAEIRGSVGDRLRVQSNLLVRSTGSVSGAISYSKIMVEEGGELSGTMEKIAENKAENADPRMDSSVHHLQRNAEVG